MIKPYHVSEYGSLFLGDCLDILPTLADKSVDLLLTDPPYGTTACEWDTVVPFAAQWEQYKRLIFDNRALIFTASQPFTTALIYSNMDMFKYELIWQKEQGTNQNLCSVMPLKCHENILVFGRGRLLYNPQFSKGKPYFVDRKNKTEKDPIIGSSQAKINTENTGKRYPTSIIEFNRELSDRYHPTQKPISLFQYLINTYSAPHNLILDPFAGSGTTAIACIRLKRRYILIEKEEKYCEIAARRIETELDQLRIDI